MGLAKPMGLLEDQHLVIHMFSYSVLVFFVQGTTVASCTAASQHRCWDYFCQTDYSSTSSLFLDRHALSPLASSPHLWRTVESSFYRSFPAQRCILPRVLSTHILPLHQLSLLINRGDDWNLTSNVGWWVKIKHNLRGWESRTELMWSKIKLVIHSCNATAHVWTNCVPAGFSFQSVPSCLCYPDLLEVAVKQGSLITGVQWLQCETWIDLLC